MVSASVVIPTYNGKKLLEGNLPALMSACAKCDFPVEIIVVDDSSTDGTVQFLRSRYPGVRVLEQRVNVGFAKAMNSGISEANGTIVLALNNDILVEEDLFTKTLHWFDDPAVFSVTPNIYNPSKSKSEAITKLKPGVCWFNTINLQSCDLQDLKGNVSIFFGSGGASFYDKRKLIQLGGFDVIYHPFYVEDMDLSYRAWKSGWKCLFESSATVYHETSSTILSIHKKRKIKFIGDRNRTLFLWLNISDPFLIARYFLFLPFSLLYDIVAIRKYKFVGFFWALKYLPRIPRLRRQRLKNFRVSDREVMKQICWP
jgi:GT2 family glycosyltransferase